MMPLRPAPIEFRERPDSGDIIAALQKVRRAEIYLEQFAEKCGIQIRAHIHLGGSARGNYSVTIYSRSMGNDSGRWFRSKKPGYEDKPENYLRNSTVAYASSLYRAEIIIHEAAEALKAKKAPRAKKPPKDDTPLSKKLGYGHKPTQLDLEDSIAAAYHGDIDGDASP